MMERDREFHASNVEEAIRKAAKALGIAPEEVRYEVLDEGSEGFLGLGARDARIRVIEESPEPAAPSKDEEQAAEEGDEAPAELLEEKAAADDAVKAADAAAAGGGAKL